MVGFCVKFDFPIFVPFHFCWKTNGKSWFLDFRNSKKCKNIIFYMVFCKKWKFWQVHLSMDRKKNFPGWFRWSKNVVEHPSLICRDKNLASFDEFFTFLMIRFFDFLATQKMRKIDFSKNANFAIFFFKFHQFCSFFLIFYIFFIKIPFFYQNFNFVF